MFSFIKIFNLIQREIAQTSQVDQSGKYLPFGPNDNFPNRLADLVAGSPTATACLSTYADFVTGEGFNEGADLENLVINSNGLKLFQFHAIQADSLVHNWGVASIVKFNKAGQTTQIYDIPFGHCRLKEPDSKGVISKILYNPYFGTNLYKRQDTKEYDVYNPSQATVQMSEQGAKYLGQIAWFGVRTSKNPFYPVPDYFSAEHWMRVEKNAGVYFDENLENGFLQDVIMKMIGDPNDPSGLKDGNDNDIPKGKAFDTEITRSFGKGAQTRHKIMAVWGNNKDEWPEIASFPNAGNADLFRVQDEHAIKKITIATKVPGVLANINDTNNFSGEQIRPAVKLMQQRAQRPQNILIDYYQMLLSNMVKPISTPITIVDYNPYPEVETIDPQVWAVLSQEEKRKWVRDHSEVDLIETPVAPTTQPATNRIVNLHFNTYPEKAKANVKRALDWQEKMGIKCSKPNGRIMSEAILNGTPLGPKEIKRLSSYLSKNTIHKDKPYDESCEAILYDAWGGSEMMVWANDKKKELNG